MAAQVTTFFTRSDPSGLATSWHAVLSMLEAVLGIGPDPDFDDLVGAEPDTVSARGRAFLRPGTEDVVFMHLDFREGPLAQVQMSWLDPHKERRLTVVGSKKMAVFDDAHPTEKIRIYDKGFDRPPDYGSFGDFLSLRDGDIHIPRISMEEPLRLEVDHFVQCVETGGHPRTDATAGFRIVRILAAAEASLRHQGTAQVVSP